MIPKSGLILPTLLKVAGVHVAHLLFELSELLRRTFWSFEKSFCTLPLAVFGGSSRKTRRTGTLKRSMRSRSQAVSS